MGERAKSGALVERDVAHLRDELDAMAAKGTLPPALRQLRAELDALGAPDAGAAAAARAARDAG